MPDCTRKKPNGNGNASFFFGKKVESLVIKDGFKTMLQLLIALLSLPSHLGKTHWMSQRPRL